MNLDEMTKARRISDGALATEIPLQVDEKVLTSADYYLIRWMFSWLRGTLYLTSTRLIWVRFNSLWIFNRGRTVVAIPLSEIRLCSARWSLWRPLGRSIMEIDAEGEPNALRLLPVHFTTDTVEWAEAINGLRRGAPVAE
jgi:hypothetical protein